MVYNRKEVVERALATVGRPNTIGMCQQITWGIIGTHPVGDVDGNGRANAVDGWKSEPESARHYDISTAPPGVPGAWSGGSAGDGHRATSIGNGRFVSSDAPVKGIMGVVHYSWFEQNWGMKPLGWSDTMSGVRIPEAPPVKTKPEVSELEVISWNIRYDTPIKQVRTELTKMIDNWNPDVIYLYEGLHFYGQLNGLGYEVYQLKPKATRPGFTPHNSNIIAMVRKGLQVKKSKTQMMKKYWKGPRNGRNQDPRTFRFLKIKKQGVVWKIGGVHFPFGADAVKEAVAYVKNLIKVTAVGRPVVVVGDFNLKEQQVLERMGRPTGSKVAGENIDLAIYKNCRLAKEQNLGKHGSDHPAWRYVFRKNRKPKKTA